MEEIKIEVVSKETVKPSSPTSPTLHHYQLSFLDQISPPVYNPLVLFYSSDDLNPNSSETLTDISSRLKTSLSETLTLYYPLAGRLKGNTYIHCADEGVPFIETRVDNCRISDVVKNPDPKSLRRFVPFVLDDMSDDVSLGIQFNVFCCGGVAVGLCLSHKIGDALSMLMLVKTWASICRGDGVIQKPEFVCGKLFPPIDISGFEPRTGIATTGDVVAKRFIFKSDVIDSLKGKYSKWMHAEEDTRERPPSRVEALSAFIWSRFAAATQIHANPKTTCFVLHAVNLRPKFEPPLPDHSFGNLYRIAMTQVSPEAGHYPDLVPKMRETVRKIDSEYVEKLRNGEEHLELIKRRSETYIKGEMMSLNFTSLCRFPVYESDFGWGKPAWIGAPALTFKNLVVFVDTKSGDGIEAYVSLVEEDMVKLEKDVEFSSTGSPIT